MVEFIKQSEVERMAHNILDPETGMTELDYYEWRGLCEDWVIIKD